MKIKTKIILLFTVVMLGILISSILISLFLKNNYVYIKYNTTYNYYYENDISIDEYADYLIEKGFIVTKSEIEGYKSGTDQVCHLQDKEIVINKNGKPVLYGIMNENIVNDFLKFMDMLLLVINLLIFILLLIVYFSYNKLIVNKLLDIEKNVELYSKTNTHNLKKYIGKKDEISSLQTEIYTMLETIENNEKSKQKLIMALSHELKTPLVKMEEIIDMYRKDVKGYDQKEEVINMILTENNKVLEMISKLLIFYNKNYNEEKKEINIREIFEKYKKDILFKNNNIKFNIEQSEQFNIEIQEQKLLIIINNIKSNLVKYTKENSIIDIVISKDKVKIINEISNSETKSSSKVGNIINEYLMLELEMDIANYIEDNKYITILNLNNKKT